MKIAVLFHRIGPYHRARLAAAVQHGQLVAIELSGNDKTYAWDLLEGVDGFQRVTVFLGKDVDFEPPLIVRDQLWRTLTKQNPTVLVVAGWSAGWALSAIQWAVDNKRPVVMLSASTEQDEVRIAWKEIIKRRVLRFCGAALVGGTPHVSYLTNLGMSKERVFTGYDVVDNVCFTAGAEKARRDAKRLRSELSLPQHYFMTTCRFIEKKNIPRLLKAYSIYRQRTSSDAWGLMLLGDGPLRDDYFRCCQELGLEQSVIFPGFKQYHELPVYYGLADAYIQASTTEQWGLVVNEAMACGLPVIVSERCGCAVDLVKEACNGFTFDPYDVDALAGLMCKLSGNESMKKTMGKESLNIINSWTPETFAEGLWKAVETALTSPQLPMRFYDRALLDLLIRR
ncbi:MAG: glycosyltransferase [Candidatus Polarisedimenticolaceae bacterium]|nr:glycosyltransferase [Candidatus Polarisedimenticolaceae bacterium]